MESGPSLFASRARAHRDYFAMIARDYDRTYFLPGQEICERWILLLEGEPALESSLELFLKLDELWLEEHFGASGWGATRQTMLNWLVWVLQHSRRTDAVFRTLANQMRRHFEKAEGEFGQEGISICERWLALIGGATSSMAEGIASEVRESSGVSTKALGHGLTELIDLWAADIEG